MDETDLQGFEEVTDPDLIATLEQSQAQINKGQGGSATSLDKQRDTAKALLAAAGVDLERGVDPIAPLIKGSTSGGLQHKAADIYGSITGDATSGMENIAKLGTIVSDMTLQLTGGSLGNQISDGDRKFIMERVGNLADPDVPANARLAAWEQVKERMKNLTLVDRSGQQQSDQNVPAAKPNAADIHFGDETGPGSNPFDSEQQALFDAWTKANPNATADQLRAFVTSLGIQGDVNAEQLIAQRDKIGYIPSATDARRGLTPEEQALVDKRVAETSAAGAAVGGAMDTLTMGAADKLGAGVDALTGSLGGEGSFSDLYGRNAAVNDAYLSGVQDEHPWAYGAGQIASGVALPMFGARSPAQIAKVAAAYGGAYGAGSSDRPSELPGNVATGVALGGVSGWAGGRLAEKIGTTIESRAAARLAEEMPPAAKEAGESAASRYARAQKFGVDPTLDAVGGRGSKIVGNTLSNMPASAQVMNSARNAMAGQVDNAVEKVAGAYGPSTDFAGLGEAAQKGARSWISKFEDVSGKAYDAIPISPKAPARLDNTRQALSELTTIFESNPKMAEAFANTRLNRYLDALAEGGDGLSWNDLKAFRTRVGEEIGEQRFSDSPTKSEMRRLYGALSEDMKATARQIGPNAERAFERANTLYRQGQQRIDDALTKILGDDGKMSPEKAAARIQAVITDGKATSNLATIHELWKSLPAAERGEVANGLIRLMGQPLNKEGRAFNPQTFIQRYTDMTPAAKNLIFGAENKELRANLDDFSKMIGDFAERKSLENSSNTAGQLLTGLGFYSVGNLPVLIGQALTSYGAARFITSPKMVRWLTGYSKMLKGAAAAGKEPTSAGILTHVRLLEKALANDPALAQDVLPLRDILLRAANDNLGRVSQSAASGNEVEAEKEKQGKESLK